MFYNTCEQKCDTCNLGICGDFERVLRVVLQGKRKLTEEEREQCIKEITYIEGYDYSNELLRTWTDEQLANTTFDAWLDFARDKGFNI